MENTNNNFIEKRLKKWCDALLDLSRRNPTLNFQTHSKNGKKKPNVFQISADSNALYQKLAIDGKSVSIGELGLVDETNDEDDEFSSLFDSNNLVKKLTRLKRDTENILEERGTHVLYLAFGICTWKEEKISDGELKSPLLFFPVNLNKTKSRDRFSIQLADMGDVEFNPTFAYILKKLYNLDIEARLNEFNEEALSDPTLFELLEFVEAELSKVVDGIFSREAWLAKFWFEKLVLFSDIQRNLDTLCSNQNIRSICGEGELNDLNTSLELDVLSKLSESRSAIDKYEVLDADSSQRVAIEAAINNKNFILVGPPGTGKSQTITNIIAECLARDKKVLFVSEKLAALKVVEKKLKDSNLGRFCLSLHGRDVKKKDFYSELYNWYETLVTNNDSLDDSARVVYNELNDKRSKLNDYVEALSATDDSLKKVIRNVDGSLKTYELNAQYIQGKLVEFESKGIPTVKSNVDLSELDELKYKSQMEVLERSLAFKDIILKEVDSDWFLTKLEGPFTRELNEKIDVDVKELKVVDELLGRYNKISDLLGLKIDLKLNKVEDYVSLMKKVIDSPSIDPVWLNYEIFLKVLRDFEKDKNLHEAIKLEKAELQKVFRLDLLDQDLEMFKRDFTEKYEGDSIRYVKKEYWDLRKRLLKLKVRNKKTPYWLKDDVIFEEIDRALIIKKFEAKILENRQSLEEKYASLYKGEDTDWAELNLLVKSVNQIFSALKNIDFDPYDNLPTELVEALGNVKSTIRKDLKVLSAGLMSDLSAFVSAFEKLENYFEIKLKKGVMYENDVQERSQYYLSTKNIGNYGLVQLFAWVSKLSDDLNSTPSMLERWFYFKKIKTKIDELGLTDFVDTVAEEYKDHYHQVTDLFEKRVFELIYMKLENEYPALANFSSDEHKELVSEYRFLDKQAITLNKDRLYKDASAKIREAIIDDNSSELKLIKKLGNQKYPRTPIRKSVREAGGFFLKLKPCWMMSPISVSQYLPPDPSLFDVVIFDEASQVRPADAIGSIFRGKQVIVVGDPRQLPPTSFFQRITQEEDSSLLDEEDALEESIIDEIKSKASNFIELPLRWHYRSKSEDLFAFANRHIYGDLKLVTFPNPSDMSIDGNELGIRHILVEDGVYDRGGSRTNQIEADKVADLVIEHFANNPIDKSDPNYLSLGIIAFSSAQEKAIVDALYRKKKEFPFIESILDDREGESFFIKNLETVQGDERDHIIISVGYGPDKDGKLSNNFGPVNQEGGERRLNVAITRAKRNLILVSSFTHKDVFLNSVQKGPNLLVKYIQYAIEGKSSLEGDVIKEENNLFTSLTDEMVFNKLKEKGIEVELNYGTSDLKLDMVVLNPHQKNDYLFAIETDGPSYFNTKSSRDRERLRTEILIDRGWDIQKVWTKELMKKGYEELDKLVELFTKKSNEAKSKIESIRQEPGIIEFDPFFSESA